MKVIDTHAHYDHKQFDTDRDIVLSNLPNSGVKFVVNVGSSMESTLASINLAKKYPHVYATVGVHPHYTSSFEMDFSGEFDDDEGEHTIAASASLQELEKLAKGKKIVAFGEIGLDFFHNFSPPDVQRKWFRKQLELAVDLALPVVIHSRDANDEVYSVVKDSSARRGVIHSFSGDAGLAEKYIELGFFIGIGGVVTFKKAELLKETVKKIPLSKIVLETDCPYLAPAPFRGKRNDSEKLFHVAWEIAKIKGVSINSVYDETTKNAETLFLLPKQ